MSHDSQKDKPQDEKVSDITPEIHRRRASDKESKTLTEIESNRDQLDNYDPAKQREGMRGLVTAIIVGVYGVCILLLVIFSLIAIMSYSSSLKEANEGFGVIGNMLSSHVVPIITLVLGFYFASEKK